MKLQLVWLQSPYSELPIKHQPEKHVKKTKASDSRPESLVTSKVFPAISWSELQRAATTCAAHCSPRSLCCPWGGRFLGDSGWLSWGEACTQDPQERESSSPSPHVGSRSRRGLASEAPSVTGIDQSHHRSLSPSGSRTPAHSPLHRLLHHLPTP